MTSKATVHRFVATIFILRGLLVYLEYYQTGIALSDFDQLNLYISVGLLGIIGLYIGYRIIEGIYLWYEHLPDEDPGRQSWEQRQ